VHAKVLPGDLDSPNSLTRRAADWETDWPGSIRKTMMLPARPCWARFRRHVSA